MTENDGGELVPVDVGVLQVAAAEQRDVRAVLDRFGYEGTSLDYLISDVRHLMAQSTEAMLEIGRAVLCFRELPRGVYGRAIRAAGLTEDTARRLASVATKFLDRDRLKPLLTLDRSKIYELALLDDQTLDHLAADATQLDQVDRMSVSELRRSLREARKNLDAKDSVIKNYGNENAALREQAIAHTRYVPNQADLDDSFRRAARLNALHAAAHDVVEAFTAFALPLRDLMQDAREGGGATEDIAHGNETAFWLAQQIANLYINLGIDVDFQEIVSPSWSRPSSVRG